MNEVATKCVNLDWLEVFCIEDGNKNAQYFKALGWNVDVREYGTPLYKEMFTLLSENGKPFLEIRRNPYSLKENGGIFKKGSCHIRLSNRTLYTENPIEQLQHFLLKYQYTFVGITRIDVCCDQIVFDNGMNPQTFINKYMCHEILKIHNSRINVHGTETTDSRIWNSIKWGSEKSPLSTKIYDKTLELQQKSDKLYIKDSWVKSGLCDLQKVVYDYTDKKTKEKSKRAKMIVVKKGTKTEEEKPIDECEQVKIWRTEFSIKSEAKHWVTVDGNHTLDIALHKFSSRERCLYMFLIIAKWCMSFVEAETNDYGVQKRKDRCTPINLYSEKNLEKTFKPTRITEREDPTRTEKIIYNRLIKMSNSSLYHFDEETKMLCKEVAEKLSIRHGNYWITDEERKRLEDYKQEMQAMKDEEKLMLDTFEGLDWVEKWNNHTLTQKEKAYFKRNKKEYSLILLNKAKNVYENARRKAEWAKKEIDFWSGQTMPIETKQVIYELPF